MSLTLIVMDLGLDIWYVLHISQDRDVLLRLSRNIYSWTRSLPAWNGLCDRQNERSPVCCWYINYHQFQFKGKILISIYLCRQFFSLLFTSILYCKQEILVRRKYLRILKICEKFPARRFREIFLHTIISCLSVVFSPIFFAEYTRTMHVPIYHVDYHD